jgi:hypothetical protein
VVVDNRDEIPQFLASRRARIMPEQAGLKLLASWAATLDRLDQPATASAPDQP